MAEAIHCPSCSTRYRLTPERLKPAIRRAKCFACGGVFPVGDLVQRLLGLPESEAALPTITTLQMEDMPPGTLTLGDLEGADAEILEKTLVDVPGTLPEAPAHEAPAPPAFPPEITESTLSGYTSARDAIEKLFGDAPTQASPKGGKDSGAMDMEATLSALEATLGASPTPPDLPPGEDLTAAGVVPDRTAESAGSTTVRLTQADLMAALQAPETPTVALRASDLAPAPGAPARAAFAAAPEGAADADLLRLKIDDEVYPGLTMPQLIAWVEEGRVLETHLVARQHSENWLEAHKVPGLRPVFERLRRERSGSVPAIESPVLEIAPKKSLFGGLFGKG